MTPEDLAAIGLKLFGPRWQTALAHAIGVTPRQMRRLKAGEDAIRPAVAERVQSLAAEQEIPDEWLIAEGEASGGLYVAHGWAPRFVASFAVNLEDEGLDGFEVRLGRDTYLIGSPRWLDAPPKEAVIARLVKEAALAAHRWNHRE